MKMAVKGVIEIVQIDTTYCRFLVYKHYTIQCKISLDRGLLFGPEGILVRGARYERNKSQRSNVVGCCLYCVYRLVRALQLIV